MHSCKNLVENVNFFKNLPMTLLIRIVSCLKSEIFLDNDVIIKANTVGDCMYFISTGTVAVYTKSGREVYTQKIIKNLPIAIIKTNSHLGMSFRRWFVFWGNIFSVKRSIAYRFGNCC